MSNNVIYQVNIDRFAHETVDGEVIIIDMDEGNYFSMVNTSALIWKLIADGRSRSGIVSALSAASNNSDAAINESVSTFLDQLVTEQILQEQSAEAQNTNGQGMNEVDLSPFDFQPPSFDKYTEMQDLLTLDPIHEVDESGWPNRAEAKDD